MPALSQFVTDLTDKRLIPKVVNNVFSGNVVTMRLMDKVRPWRGGTKISQPVYMSAPTTGGSYSGFDAFTTSQETKTQRAEFDPSQYYWNVSLSGIQLAINQSGDVGAIDLVASELDIAAEGLKQALGTDVYGDGTNNSSKALLGLLAAVDDTTLVTTYGGLSRSTYTNWRGTVTAQSGSFSLANLAADFDAAQVGSDTPTLIATTPAVWTIYEALLTPTVSHNATTREYRLTPDGTRPIEGLSGNQGFRALAFRGIPVVADEKCPAGYVFTLNENHLFMWKLNQPAQMNRSENRGFGWTGFKEPVNQDAIAGQLLWYGQLTTDSPRTHARRTGVTS